VVSVVSEDGCRGLTRNRGEGGRPRPWGSREGSGSTRRSQPCSSSKVSVGSRSVALRKRPRAAWVGVAAAELHLVGTADPVQEPEGVLCAGVGAHEGEHRLGVVGQVVGQLDGAGEGVGVDRLGTAFAQVGCKV
jgi:hypothetical protein